MLTNLVEKLSRGAEAINTMLAASVLVITLCAIWHLAADRAKRGKTAFFVFLGLWAVVVMLEFFILRRTHWDRDHYWVVLCIDLIGNCFVLAAAYAIYQDTEFVWADRNFIGLGICAVGLLLWCFVLGEHIASESGTWRVFVMAPSQVLACVSFVAVGVAGFHRVPDFRVPIILSCVVYSLLQVPMYHALIVEPLYVPQDPTGASVTLKLLLAGGKLMFIVLLASILGFVGGGTTDRTITWVNRFLTILNILLLVGIIHVRIAQIAGAGIPAPAKPPQRQESSDLNLNNQETYSSKSTAGDDGPRRSISKLCSPILVSQCLYRPSSLGANGRFGALLRAENPRVAPVCGIGASVS